MYKKNYVNFPCLVYRNLSFGMCLPSVTSRKGRGLKKAWGRV